MGVSYANDPGPFPLESKEEHNCEVEEIYSSVNKISVDFKQFLTLYGFREKNSRAKIVQNNGSKSYKIHYVYIFNIFPYFS